MEHETRTIVIVGQGGIQTDLDLDTLADSEVADVIPDMLVDYSAECRDWTLIAKEHWRANRWSRAEDLLHRGLQFFGGGGAGRHSDPGALVNIHAMLAHLHLAAARTAPKVIIPHARYDIIQPNTRTKEYHYTEATANLNRADDALRASGAAPEDEPVSVAMGKIILYLARGQPAVAHPLVDHLLQRQPTNLVALAAQARLQFARRAHEAAFATYQKMLGLDPEMKPDPRIGLGLCAWMLNDRERARKAWQRALERDPQSWVTLLLLGLGALNGAREPLVDTETRLQLEMEGVDYIQRAFKLNNKSAASALALASVAARGGKVPLAAKLAEHAIQYADNKRHSVLANAERGRLGFVAGDVADAGPFIAAAKGEEPAGVNILAELTLSQIAIKNGNLREALNFVEQTVKRLGGKGPVEFTVIHASLLAYPHPGMPPDELARNRATARSMLTDLHTQVTSAATDEDVAKLRGVIDDADIFVELAKLWQDESLEKSIAAYRTAVSIKADAEADAEEQQLSDSLAESQDRKVATDYTAVRMSSNLGSLFALQGNAETAERMYQESLKKLTSDSGKDAEVLKTVLAFNLGRACEDGGEVVKAAQWYRDVLRQHPEHMESKIRLASLAMNAGRNADAHRLLKECLQADETNLLLRSVYTHFLISIGSYKEALAFTTQTLKHDRSDVYTFCSLGWLHFTLGREARGGQELAERNKQYLRSAEAYERALVLDPTCAVAAQGLAIALAEDTLAPKQQQLANAVDEQKQRIRMAGQALMIFSRIKDSIAEGGAVNVNIGHCYFARGEEERAIEAYGAASTAYKGRNVSVLLYLARTWYVYANRESNFSAMSQALSYCQKAMHIQPSDRAILYNIAMIQQKAAEMLLAIDPSKRTLDELKTALTQAQQAVNTFRALADDRSGVLAYDADLADQRARYGESLLRKAPEQITRQEAYENEAQARVEEARKARAEEQARIQAAETTRRAEIEAKAAELAEQRRIAREEAQKWQEERAAQLAEEELRKIDRIEQRKRKKDVVEKDDEVYEGEDGEVIVKPKRKKRAAGAEKEKSGGGGRKGRKVRSKSEIEESEEEEVMDEGLEEDEDEEEGSGGEEVKQNKIKQRLAMLRKKKKAPKRHVEDPDEGEDVGANRKGKQFKSKAFIEDSDDEDEELGPAADADDDEGDGDAEMKDDDEEEEAPAQNGDDEDNE